jgi:hydroxymethylpyrimidine kinase/phosphomethylpyrimidine kinase/thiamine-phosphate diphosphorylase
MSSTIPRGGKTPIVWGIAGSDSCAGAGLQADLKTLTALGAHGCTIVTSVTAQNSAAVRGIESVSPEMLSAQIEALREDMPPQAIKIGMLGDAAGVRVLAEALGKIGVYTVYDPVMLSSSGAPLLGSDTLAAMREVLLPRVDLLTPNLAEAEALTGLTIRSDADVEQAATALLKSGAKSVFIKGWDAGKGFVQDFYRRGATSFWLTLPKHSGAVPRGTGCALASALAAAHAFGFDEADSAVIAKAYTHRCLRLNQKLGKGPPLAEHRPWPVEAEDFPWLTETAEAARKRPKFPDCGEEPLGFYPIVDSAAWLRRILPLGVQTAQLRVKNLQGGVLESEIRVAIDLARAHGARLFINDHWQLAIRHKAYGVHLGQDDLAAADVAALEASGLRLGLSTHSYAEAARAHAFRPSYIALGPIFPTALKSMNFAPQGVETLRIWRQIFSCPLVAIGGIALENASEIYAAGADSIAVVSDVAKSANPDERVRSWLKVISSPRELGENLQMAAAAITA